MLRLPRKKERKKERRVEKTHASRARTTNGIQTSDSAGASDEEDRGTPKTSIHVKKNLALRVLHATLSLRLTIARALKGERGETKPPRRDDASHRAGAGLTVP